MSSFEKLQRRNLDVLLIETIKRVGISNYSLVGRLTGINPETVRYKVNKQLNKYGLDIGVNINYSELGFASGILKVKARQATGKSWTDRLSYLNYVGKVIGSDRFECLYSIPSRFKSKYIETLESLKRQGIIEDYSVAEFYWFRYPYFRSEFYDFEKQSWQVDWRRVENTADETGMNIISFNRDSKVDYIDLVILRSMQEDPTITPSKIARETNINDRTVRYHHAEHVLKGNLILGNNIRWSSESVAATNPNKIMQVVYSFKRLPQQDYEPVRKLFNKVPFTWFEASTEDKSYFAFLDMPIEYFHETADFIESHIQLLASTPEMSVLDAAKTLKFNLREEMYDRKRGWRLPNYEENNLQALRSTQEAEVGEIDEEEMPPTSEEIDAEEQSPD